MISFAGDTCPIGEQHKALSKEPFSVVSEELRNFMYQNEAFIVNLECPITENSSPIVKCGPNLKANKSSVMGLKSLNVTHFSLANNHIMDHGAIGLEDTLQSLNEIGVSYWGAANTEKELNAVQLIKLKEKNVAVISISEHEFSIVGKNRPGAYGLNIVENVKLIRKCNELYDFVVILYHGGVEHYQYPTPQQQQTLRFFIEEGADLILCQHSHMIGAIENYKHGVIYYGQGNFFFENKKPKGDWWNQGLIVSLSINNNDTIQVTHKLIQQSVGEPVKLFPMSDLFIKNQELLSKNVSDDNYVRDSWINWVKTKEVDYFSRLYGWSRLKRVVCRKLGFYKPFINKEKAAIVRNVVECESHHQALMAYWSNEEYDYLGRK